MRTQSLLTPSGKRQWSDAKIRDSLTTTRTTRCSAADTRVLAATPTCAQVVPAATPTCVQVVQALVETLTCAPAVQALANPAAQARVRTPTFGRVALVVHHREETRTCALQASQAPATSSETHCRDSSSLLLARNEHQTMWKRKNDKQLSLVSLQIASGATEVAVV